MGVATATDTPPDAAAAAAAAEKTSASVSPAIAVGGQASSSSPLGGDAVDLLSSDHFASLCPRLPGNQSPEADSESKRVVLCHAPSAGQLRIDTCESRVQLYPAGGGGRGVGVGFGAGPGAGEKENADYSTAILHDGRIDPMRLAG